MTQSIKLILLGLTGISVSTLLACESKSTDSSTESTTEENSESARTRPEQILATLQANIRQDLPVDLNEAEDLIAIVATELEFGTEEELEFRFFGKEFNQDLRDYNQV